MTKRYDLPASSALAGHITYTRPDYDTLCDLQEQLDNVRAEFKDKSETVQALRQARWLVKTSRQYLVDCAITDRASGDVVANNIDALYQTGHNAAHSLLSDMSAVIILGTNVKLDKPVDGAPEGNVEKPSEVK